MLSFAAKGLTVNINDINEQTLATLKSGRVPFIENDAQPLLTKELRLHALIRDVKEKGGRIVGISAPSRASTLVNYVGLDEAIIDYVCEIEGSLKIGKCMPGTLIPVVEESRMFVDQPECAIIFSWHIADELAPKLRAKGYKGHAGDAVAGPARAVGPSRSGRNRATLSFMRPYLYLTALQHQQFAGSKGPMIHAPYSRLAAALVLLAPVLAGCGQSQPPGGGPPPRRP